MSDLPRSSEPISWGQAHFEFRSIGRQGGSILPSPFNLCNSADKLTSPPGHRAPRRGVRQMTDKQKNGQEHLRLQCELELGKNKAVMKQRVRVWRCQWSVGHLEEVTSTLQPK